MQVRPPYFGLKYDFCASVRDFAFSFIQIPPHGEHPCCSADSSCWQARGRLSAPSYCQTWP